MITKKQLSSYVRTEEEDQNGKGENVLDLSKKQLRKINQIDIQSLSVSKIDLSYNFIKTLSLINIVKPPIINSSRQPTTLKQLDVSFNILQGIDLKKQQNISVLRQLQYLNACTNKIQSVNLSDKSYPYLKQLHLKNNRIKYFIHCPNSLEVLTLDKNHLNQLSFTGGQSLEILSASHNDIDKIAIKTPELIFLDLENNQLLNMDAFYEFLENSKKLLSINMLQNPLDVNKNYKIIVLSTCPKIVQIDEVFINPHVREGFRILREEQKLDEVLQRTTQNYKKRLEAQLEFKEQMIEKLKLQEKQIEQKFHTYCQRQQQQMQILEEHAKNTLGHRKFKVADQKDEFVKKVNNQDPNLMDNPNQPSYLPEETKKNKKINLQTEQLKYKMEYQDFQRQNLEKIKRQQMIQNKQNFDTSNNSPIKQSKVSDNQSFTHSQIKNQNQPKNSYRQYRQSILKKGSIDGLQFIGQQVKLNPKPQKIESYKKIAQKSLRESKQNQKQNTKIQLKDVIDMRCINFLSKHYSFYQ